MKSKTIIISSAEEGAKSGRGILTLFQDEDLLKCRLRLYNTPKLNRFCKLGIYHNKEVFSANLLEKNGAYESSFVGDFDLDNDFFTAIIDTSQNNKVMLSGGTYSGYYFNDLSVFENEVEPEISTSPNEETNINFDKPNIQNQCENDCDKCANCKYKEYFYSQQNNVETSTAPPPKQAEKEEKIDIMRQLVPQFEQVFNNYPNDETLNQMITNSRFVKINENNQEYSIGAIYEDEKMKYICYATKCDYNTPAPQELGENYQWLPLDKEDPLSEGYYVVFQDANDLKILKF